MRPWRNKRVLLVMLLVIWSTVFYLAFISPRKSFNIKMKIKDDYLELLWWTGVPATYSQIRNCGYHTCRVSNKRSNFKKAHALLFYASDMSLDDEMPLPRKWFQIWALLHDESPRNVPYAAYNEFLKHFNYTSTFSRHSNFPLTTQYLPQSNDLTSRDFTNTFERKNVSHTGLARVVFLQSDCDTMSGREDYVRELMDYIDIDSYGSCLNNRGLPDSLKKDYLNNMYSPNLLNFLSRYKFMIAIENGVCDDYITEKYWRPLVIGVIPIYFGSPTIRDWQPNKKSAIYIDDFKSPKDLADYIMHLEYNGTAYNQYQKHKLNSKEPIENKLLIDTLIQRRYSIASENLFNEFECYICNKVATQNLRGPPQIATIKDYNCPLPPVQVPVVKRKLTNTDHWKSIMALGRCQAQVLDKFWSLNQSYTYKQFEKELNGLVVGNFCNE